MGNNKDIGITDNLIFEAIETFLPIATRANPEPLVTADPSDIDKKLPQCQSCSCHEADVQKLRRKLAKMARGWLINRVGVLKVSWDPRKSPGCIKTEVINAKLMIFDKNGHIDEGGNFTGDYLGERKKLDAKTLAKMFPNKSELIKEKSTGKKGDNA